nr:unnamed protein product [Callosobruchus analis]
MDQTASTANQPENFHSASKEQMRTTLPTLPRECDRASVSDRAAAKVADSHLELISGEDTSHAIDRSQIRRERQKFRTTQHEEEETFVLKAIDFEGRKDRTLKFENIDGRLDKR